MGSMSIGHWIIVLVIVLVVFGTKRLSSGARDLGKAVNEFKKGVHGEEDRRQLPDERSGDAAVRREDERVER